MSFESIDQAATWAGLNGGEAGLRIAIEDGRFGNNARAIAYANAWLSQMDSERKALLDADDRALRSREVSAAETSAKAAIESANAAVVAAAAAKNSATWALWAVIVALVTIIVGLLAK